MKPFPRSKREMMKEAGKVGLVSPTGEFRNLNEISKEHQPRAQLLSFIYETSLLKDRSIQKCSILSFYSSTCHKFPIRLIKTVRFRVEDSEKLLLDPDIGKNLKIIFLVRDPRGVMKSRSSQAKWCNFAECSNPDILCKNMQNDVSAAFRLRVRYTGE